MSLPIFGKCLNQLKNTGVYFPYCTGSVCMLDILIEMSNCSNVNNCVSFPRARFYVLGKCFNQLNNFSFIYFSLLHRSCSLS